MMLTKNAMGNLVNKYVAVLRKCALLNACVLGLVCGGLGLDSTCTYARDLDVSMTKDFAPISLTNTKEYKVDSWNDDLAYKDDYTYTNQTEVWWGQHGHAGEYLNFFDDVVMDDNSNLVFDFDSPEDGTQSNLPCSISVRTTAAIYLGRLDSRDTTDPNITWTVDYSDTLSITGGSLWAIGEVGNNDPYNTYGVYIFANTNDPYGLNYFAEIKDTNVYFLDLTYGIRVSSGELTIDNIADDGSKKDVYIRATTYRGDSFGNNYKSEYGIYGYNSNIVIEAGKVNVEGGDMAICLRVNSELNLTADAFTVEKSEYGLWLQEGAKATIGGDDFTVKNTGYGIVMFSDNNLDINSQSVAFSNNLVNIYMASEGSVDINCEDLYIDATSSSNDDGDYAIMNIDKGTINIETDKMNFFGKSDSDVLMITSNSGGPINFAAKSGEMKGSVVAQDAGTINIDFSGAKSPAGVTSDGLHGADALLWTGSADGGDGDINVKLGSGAHWDVTANSTISDLTLEAGAVVSLSHESVIEQDSTGNSGSGGAAPMRAMATNAAQSPLFARSLPASGAVSTTSTVNETTLIVDKLYGKGGTFFFHANIDADDTDQVVIASVDDASDDVVFHVHVETSEKASELDMDKALIKVADKNYDAKHFKLDIAQHPNGVDAEMYYYELAYRDNAAGTGGEWYLKRGELVNNKTPSAELVLGLSGMAAPYASWYSRMSDLRERLGEVRYGQENDGVWVRGFAEENTLSGLTDTDFEQKVYGSSFGYDRLLDKRGVNENQWLFGVRGQITRGEQEVDGRFESTGESESVGLAAYASWFDKNGWYADTVLTVDWFGQEMDTFKEDGTHVDAEYDTLAGGISQEVGRKFVFDNLMFIEPQLQLSYYVNKGADYTTSNHIDVDVATGESLTGRAGLVFGKRWNMSDERYFQPYVKAGVTHEFLGEQKSTIDGEHFYGDLGGTRYYYGIGLDWQCSQSFRFYGEFEREEGDEVSKPWSASVGLRYSF